MSPRLALIVGAAQSFVFGLPLLLLPSTVLAVSGLTLPDAGVAIARGAGATVTGVGVIDWMLRNTTGAALRGLLVGNLAVQVFSFIVNGGELLAGHLPIQAASASVLHLVLSVMFLLALRAEARTW
jgi:hypothetical protein